MQNDNQAREEVILIKANLSTHIDFNIRIGFFKDRKDRREYFLLREEDQSINLFESTNEYEARKVGTRLAVEILKKVESIVIREKREKRLSALRIKYYAIKDEIRNFRLKSGITEYESTYEADLLKKWEELTLDEEGNSLYNEDGEWLGEGPDPEGPEGPDLSIVDVPMSGNLSKAFSKLRELEIEELKAHLAWLEAKAETSDAYDWDIENLKRLLGEDC